MNKVSSVHWEMTMLQPVLVSSAPASARRDARPTGDPARVIALHRPLWRRLWEAVADRHQRAQERAHRQACQRALAQLDAWVLRDVGLHETMRAPARPTWAEIERLRW
jgi:hypothetical protein